MRSNKMRTTVAVLLLGHALACATPVLAAEPNPEVVDEADFLRVQNATLRLELAARAYEDAKRVADDEAARVRGKYKLSDSDSIDPQTRAIRRAKAKDQKK
jgi:hypothetical protein